MDQQYTGNQKQERHDKVFESRNMTHLQASSVQEIKQRAAHLLAEIDGISIPPDNKEVGGLVSLAKTSLEESVMWAVKALSRVGL